MKKLLKKSTLKRKKYRTAYYKKNKETERTQFKEYYDSEEGKAYFKEYYKNNKEKLLIKNKKYRAKNRGKINKQKTEYLKNRYTTNKNYNLICRMRRQFYNRVKAKHKTFREKDTWGIDWNIIIESLGKLPQDIKEYHLDHIIPLNNFNFFHLDGSLNNTEIKKAWSPANLRLINSKENMIKGSKVDLEKHPIKYEHCL